MDQNQWFNAGSPAPMNDRQAFEAGWTAAQRQMAYAPQAPKSDSDRMEMSTSAKMHIGETIATLRDMWHDADPDLREKMKKDFSALLQEMN